ncbi:MAG: lipocalin-like domain-containing protein [Bdellovibrio sp.]
MAHSSLIGTWSLLSYTGENLEGQTITIRDQQSGSLEYTADGCVRMEIKRNPEMLRDLKIAPDLAHVSYSGRFEVNNVTNEVYHFIECADRPDRVGNKLKRTFVINSDYLKIQGQGLKASVTLVWRRVIS